MREQAVEQEAPAVGRGEGQTHLPRVRSPPAPGRCGSRTSGRDRPSRTFGTSSTWNARPSEPTPIIQRVNVVTVHPLPSRRTTDWVRCLRASSDSACPRSNASESYCACVAPRPAKQARVENSQHPLGYDYEHLHFTLFCCSFHRRNSRNRASCAA